MPEGRFITLEGGEGVGKSTNLELVARTVEAAGHRVIRTREPGGTPLAEEIRALLLGVREESITPVAELLLVFAARAQHLEALIKPALAQGDWVVCDRFTDATYAYQGAGRDLDNGVIAQLETLVQGRLQPDLTIYLDLNLEIAAQRISGRELDRFEREQQDFFLRVRERYLEMAGRESRYRVVDAGQSLESVQQEISSLLAEFLGADS